MTYFEKVMTNDFKFHIIEVIEFNSKAIGSLLFHHLALKLILDFVHLNIKGGNGLWTHTIILSFLSTVLSTHVPILSVPVQTRSNLVLTERFSSNFEQICNKFSSSAFIFLRTGWLHSPLGAVAPLLLALVHLVLVDWHIFLLTFM